MSGYTPVFSSVFTGTLHGRWPDTGLWLCLLALADRNGAVDVTPQYIASVTGLDVEQVTQCINRFLQPDEYSRTKDNDGRRLVLLDPERPWGWRIVNHDRYREKARLISKSSKEVEEGRNRQRMQARTAGDRRSPPVTAADPLSDSDVNRDNPPSLREDPQSEAEPDGLDRGAWERWQAYRRGIRKPIKPASVPAAQRKLAGYGADQATVVEHCIAQGYMGLWAPRDGTAAPPRTTANAAAAQAFVAKGDQHANG